MFTEIPYFRQELPADLNRVNAVITAQVRSEVVLIEQIGQYIIGAGGKRLRPITAILAGKALGYDADELYRQAAMVEFIHTSTLLHDDVVDESDKRRGRATANNLFGNAAAVLVGDFLYTRAFQLMVGAGSMKLMQVMADATNIIAAGEVMQLINIGNTDLTENEYLTVIQSKTAKLFEAAAQVGAILAQATPEQENALKNYGMHMGTAFQIVDDILDYAGNGEDIGKNLGDDLAEGKATLPLIYLMQHGSPQAADAVRDALTHARRDNFPRIHEYIMQSDALAYSRQHAQAAADAACACLQALPANAYTDTLQQLAQQSVLRLN
ncbi:MAG: polyprenyl synthetase family protein [Neisseria sp.]|nr:polyprenyl synthetase family protein [Neisseria sp.]